MIITNKPIFLRYSPHENPQNYFNEAKSYLDLQGWNSTPARNGLVYFSPKHSFPDNVGYVEFSQGGQGIGQVQIELPEINPQRPVTGEDSKFFKTLLELLQPTSLEDWEFQKISPIDLVF
jgi:hypothetical protein